MDFPAVSIVGRPNVGKSSVFNRLASRRIAIVDPQAGVTRDRVSSVVVWEERSFELVDTGGMTFERRQDPVAEQVARQIEFAISQANLILFVVDVQEGPSPIEREIADSLRRMEKPVLLVANKADNRLLEAAASEFHSLGLGEPLAMSALHGMGREELLDLIVDRLPEGAVEPDSPELKLALIGRQNVGKSTLLNTLAREERAIVTEVPGTTRDSYDVRFQWEGREVIAIDTAGLKKASSIKSSVEFYSAHRSQRSIRRADVVLLMIDAAQEISRVDKKAGAYICEQFKPCIVTVNKWDLVEGITPERYVEYLRAHLPALSHAPISFISAKTGFNVQETIELAFSLHEEWKTRISTGPLNAAVQELLQRRSPRPVKNRIAKIYYATQVSVAPPTIVMFANDPSLFSRSYLRYLEHGLRDAFPFSEVPLKLIVRQRKSTQTSSTSI